MQNAKIYLAEALIELMKTKDLKDIHVKDIVKRAGVSRMTYYRYFEDKEEILHSYMKNIMDEYLELEKQTKHKFGTYEHILQNLNFFKQYKDYALCLHKAGMGDLILECVNKYVVKNEKHSFSLYFYAGALFNTYMQWIFEDTKTPAEELAHMICRENRN